MSVHVSSWCWRHSQSNGNDRLVLLTIADMADDDGTNAWPSYATISARCRISERTAIRCVDRLQELGELAVEHRAGPPKEGKTRQRSNVYSFPAYRIREGLQKGCQSVRASTGEEVTPETESSDTGGESSDTAVSQDPSLDPSLETSFARDARDHDQTGGFELSEPPAVKAKVSKRTRSETAAPEPFEVTLAMRQWFREQGLAAAGVDGRLETDQFLDHHRAKGTKFKRWDLAWQTWMRNAGKFARQHRRVRLEDLPADDWRRFVQE